MSRKAAFAGRRRRQDRDHRIVEAALRLFLRILKVHDAEQHFHKDLNEDK
jgi:hypothetical protein